MAFPFSAALSIRAIASYKHFAMSSKAMTSPFSTTGKCLNFPAKNQHSVQLASCRIACWMEKVNMVFRLSATLHHLLQGFHSKSIRKNKNWVPCHNFGDWCFLKIKFTSNDSCCYVLQPQKGMVL